MKAGRFSIFGWAAGSAVAACVAACSVPWLAVGLFGSGAFATALTRIFRPGAELVVGGVTFALVLGALAMKGWKRKARALSTGEHCPAGCGSREGAQRELSNAR